MSNSIFSNQWYRVKDIRPQLHPHIDIHRHTYRGSIWFILEDKASGRHHRFNETSFRFMGLLDGYKTVNEAWELNVEHFGDNAPNQHEVIQLLGQLFAANLLNSNVLINVDELLARQNTQRGQLLTQLFNNPLSQKFPLWDPDAFLSKHLNQVNFLFTRSAFLLWLVIVISGGLLAASHWQELTSYTVIKATSPYNLTLMFVLYPFVKFLHELGHAFATKIEGGEVHEMGITFLLLVPVPYVNVSTASHFRNKYKRILVSLAGIMVELLLSTLSLFIWLAVEPGLVHDIAFNILLLGGVSSLFFNGNPLLKYDGYYVFADALELPNLAQRANQYYKYLCLRYLFGFKYSPSPATGMDEVLWLFGYGIASYIYRLMILWFIVVFVVQKFFIIGIILAGSMVVAQIFAPLLKIGDFIYQSLDHRKHRLRIIGVSLSTVSLLVALLVIIPFPSYTSSEGVVWLPERAHIRAENEGFVGPLLSLSNSHIQPKTDIILLDDPFLETKVKILQAKKNELEANYRAEQYNEKVKAQQAKDAISAIDSELIQAQKKLQAMQVKAPHAGRLLIPDAEDLSGRFVKQGDLLGYVIDQSLPIVRTIVTQADIGKFRAGTIGVELRLANHLEKIIPARIVREIPGASDQLYSEALSSTGGGKILLDPNQPDSLTTLEKFFQVDIEFTPPDTQVFIGTRAYVRFNHGHETLATQWYHSFRQLFLSKFNV